MSAFKYSILLLIVLAAGFNLSCTDEGKIAAAIEDGKELQEGDPVPFLLYQNYPDPFNFSTTIRFGVPAAIHLKLTVFTDDWQEVETLFDKGFTEGYNSVIFSTKPDLPSGEYYYTMEGGGVIEIRKMHLIK
jgi:hypothetical protein